MPSGRKTGLGLWTPGDKEFGDRGGHHVHFAFSATPNQRDALAAQLRAGDVNVTGAIDHPGRDRLIYFQDPCGNLVEIWDFFEREDQHPNGIDALNAASRSSG